MHKLTVTVTDKFKVEIDDNNHTLLEWVEPNLITVGKYKGTISEGKWSIIGYYSNMSGALYRLSTIEGWDESHEELREYANRTLTKASELLKGIDTRYGSAPERPR